MAVHIALIAYHPPMLVIPAMVLVVVTAFTGLVVAVALVHTANSVLANMVRFSRATSRVRIGQLQAANDGTKLP